MIKRNKAIIGFALCCAFLVFSSSTVQKAESFVFLIPLVFGIAVGVGYLTAWVIHYFDPPGAGVTPDSTLSLFYTDRANQMKSWTTTTNDEASSVSAMGYFWGRPAEYATMNFLDNNTYPTYPRWEIFNASIGWEVYNVSTAIRLGYSNTIQEAILFAQTSFTGPLSGLSMTLENTGTYTQNIDVGTLTGHNFDLMYGFIEPAWTGNQTLGMLVVNGTCNIIWKSANNADQFKIYLDDQIANNLTVINNAGAEVWNHWYMATLTTGVYNVSWHAAFAETYFLTNGVMIEVESGMMQYNKTEIVDTTALATGDSSVNPLYDQMDFTDTSLNTYTVSTLNNTECNFWAFENALDLAQHFAMTLSSVYWTTLENAGIHQASDIPSNLVIPLPDFSFISNADMANLTQYEIAAMYLAYMHALANFFNSTTYTSIINFTQANVTFSNEAVLVNGELTRNSTHVTNGTLYLQIYADMSLQLGLNTLNSSGLVYNLNDTTCFSYAAGDVLNITGIYVKDPSTGLYVSCTNATIQAANISAYLYTPTPAPPLVPTGGGGAPPGGGGSMIFLLIGAIVVLALYAKAKSGSGGGGTVIISRG